MSKISGRRSRPQRPQFLPARSESVRRLEGGGEVCLNNAAGRAEYQRRREEVWAAQYGECDLCNGYVHLDDARLTSGDWQESQQRNDVITSDTKMTHKRCLAKWHERRAKQIQEQVIGISTSTSTSSTSPTLRLIFALIFVLSSLFVPHYLLAQAPNAAAISGQVTTPYGGPAASATVRVCSIIATGLPCSPVVNLYSDYNLTQQIPNPISTDQNGNYKAFVAGGLYLVQVTLAGPTGQTFTYYANAGAASGSSLPASPAFAVNFTNSIVTALQGDATFTFNPTSHTLQDYDAISKLPRVNVQHSDFGIGSPVSQITLGGNLACSQGSQSTVTIGAPSLPGGVQAQSVLQCSTGNTLYVIQMRNEGAGYNGTESCSISGGGTSGATCALQLRTPGPADPTGHTCSDTAVQQAIGYAIGQIAVNGALPEVYMPSGTYLFCNTVDVPMSLNVVGDGATATTITHNGDFPEFHYWNPGSSVAGSAVSGAWINLGGLNGVTLLGRSTLDTSDLFEANGGAGLQLNDVNLMNTAGYCLNLSTERVHINNMVASVCRYPELFQGVNEVVSINNQINAPGFFNLTGTQGSGINTVNGAVMNQFNWPGGTLVAAKTDGSGGAAFSVTASVASPIVTGMWFQVQAISDLTTLNGTWQATNILNNCSAASSPFNSGSTCATPASGEFVAIATLTSGFMVPDLDWRGVILQNPSTATPAAGSSTGLSSATWKPAVFPQYNPAIWDFESQMHTYIRSSIKSTALSTCLQSMSNPVSITGFYCEEFSAGAVNPGFMAVGAMPYTVTTTLITPGPVISPVTICAGTTPCTLGVVSDNWFPNVSAIPYPNEYGAHFMQMTIVPCDYNPSIATQSACAPAGVNRNMFEIIGVVFLKPGTTALVLTRNLVNSTAPANTVWPIGSKLGFVEGFSGLQTGTIVADVDHVTAPNISATAPPEPISTNNYAYIANDNSPFITCTYCVGVVPDYVMNFPVGTTGQMNGVTGGLVMSNALAAPGSLCSDASNEFAGESCVKVVGNANITFFGNIVNTVQVPQNATDLANCTAYRQFSFPVIFAQYTGGINSGGMVKDETTGTFMANNSVGTTNPCQFYTELISHQGVLATQFGGSYFIEDVGPAGVPLGFSNRWIYNLNGGNGFEYVTTHDGINQIPQFTIGATLATGLSETGISDHLNQLAQGSGPGFAGTCTMTTTSCTITLATAFTNPPVCIATPRGTTAIAGACSVSGTTVTITAATSNTLTWNVAFFGNPN